MAKVSLVGAIHGWYPDLVLNWMTGSDDCTADTWDESSEHLNTYYVKADNTYQRNLILTENTSSWNNTQKEELYEIYVSSSLASEFSSSLGL